jgi:hypothetical protein
MKVTFNFNRMKYRNRAECQLADLGAVPTVCQSMYLTKYKHRIHFTPSQFPATKRRESPRGVVNVVSVKCLRAERLGVWFHEEQEIYRLSRMSRQDMEPLIRRIRGLLH